ncbi:hypothetical protein [Actinoplanes sp. NPDC049118]|uniref:hypothetical protein n=1 Tax=Actinoplanes sp. NPDC049118 TaxID=3155769 RepID=UPI003401FC3A
MDNQIIGYTITGPERRAGMNVGLLPDCDAGDGAAEDDPRVAPANRRRCGGAAVVPVDGRDLRRWFVPDLSAG